MPVLFVFLLKVNIALLLFCAGYYLVLRHLTFYTLNRIYLAAAILFSTIYPQINISGFAGRHQELSKPVQTVVITLEAPARALITPLARPDYWRWVEVIFWTGAVMLAIRLLMQLYSLFKLYRNSKPSMIYNHNIRLIDTDAGPFSFWNSIYVNPARHEPADLEAILLHEQVHVSEWHTLDILLAELSTIFYWFNPGVWLMKKAVRENIEFITDRKILKNGVDTKTYQYSLVNVSFAASTNPIVNHFNISTIKKRIIMMNAKRSSKFNLTRYAFLVPAVVVLLLVFSISKAALVTEGHYTYKALSNSIKKFHKKVTTSDISAASIIAGKNQKITETAVAATPLKLVDTLKSGKITIGTTERADSLTYVINGVKMKKADFKNLDPDKIYSIEILTGQQANKLLDEIDGKHSVLFVTTDDSEAGKKFKEKIDDLNDHSFTIAANGANFRTFKPDSNFIIASKARTWNLKGSARKFRVGALKKARGFASVNGTWVLTDSTRPVVIVGKTDSILVRGTKPAREREMAAITAYGVGRSLNYTPRAITLNKFRYNNETNINHLSSKLIMINGKEASEHDLKKLSAADIESMSVRSGDEIVKQYGEKAKDGVLFIETKKKK